MAHVEKHHRKPCDRCKHAHARHQSTAPRCRVTARNCTGWRAQSGDRETWRARWRDPAGKEHAKTFARKIDAERHILSIEDAKLRDAYVDPAAGRTRFGPWAERWYTSTAHLKPTTRRDYRKLLDQQVLPGFRSPRPSGARTAS